jgi:tetratricopeptide (TPR) repeat protein
MQGAPTMESIDAFVSRVTEVSDMVSGLAEGRLSGADVEKYERQVSTQRESKKEEKVAQRHWRGKGEKDQYERFCERCGIEHADQVEKCAVCRQIRQATNQVSASELSERLFARITEFGANNVDVCSERVDSLMAERERAEKRRQRWKRFEQQHIRRGTIDYERWDAWEPDQDEDELGEPDPNDSRFHALERDFQEREQKRRERRQRSDDLKKQGNACFARQEYHKSIEWYTKALEERKDAKEIYANRALARLRCQHAMEARADCDSGLEIAEFLEGSRCSPNNSVLYKLWTRRASANLMLRRPDEAEADIREGALACRPGDKDALQLLQQCERVRNDLKISRLSKQREKGGDETIKLLTMSLDERDWTGLLRILRRSPGGEIRELLRAKGAIRPIQEGISTNRRCRCTRRRNQHKCRGIRDDRSRYTDRRPICSSSASFISAVSMARDLLSLPTIQSKSRE